MEDGLVNGKEHQALKDLRQRLGISAEYVERLHQAYLRDHPTPGERWPHCQGQIETLSAAQIH